VSSFRPTACALLLLGVSGCASALPTFTGGSTTPERRGDVGVGGAARVPTGDLKRVDDPLGSGFVGEADAGGVAPVAYGRYGLPNHLDLGLMVAGTVVRLDLRWESVVVEDSTRPAWIVGVAPYGGWIVGDETGEGGGRVGIEVPVAYGIDFGGIYDVWVGVRAGAERAFGDFDQAGVITGAHATGVRGGAMIGMALGFRRLHALLELTAAYERWWGAQGSVSLDRGGFVLIPAFALRLRI